MRPRHAIVVRARRTASTATLLGMGLGLTAAACSHAGQRPGAEDRSSTRVAAGANLTDPTLRPARFVPEAVDGSTDLGTEPDGGARALVEGLRVVLSNHGAVVVADDRLPQAPAATVALPDRLGGGFLFLLGATVWRAERWLDPVTPIFTSSEPVRALLPGLDRVYVRAQRTTFAIDGRTGRLLDLGPWPESPHVESYAAADGWRAAAIADLRGVVATFDAGATWRPVALPFEATNVAASGGGLAVGGFDRAERAEVWYELHTDGAASRLDAPPRNVQGTLAPPTQPGVRAFPSGVRRPPVAPPPPTPPPTPSSEAAPLPSGASVDPDEPAAKIFGVRPLASAVEDGWPLTDDTAVVARDGALARVRLSDGALVDFARDAFPLASARCHPIPLTRPADTGAFGFVCGEPRGATVLYAYDSARSRLVELRRFDAPRVVVSSGNGALAVRGGCAADANDTPAARPTEAKLPARTPRKTQRGARDPAAKTTPPRASDKARSSPAASARRSSGDGAAPSDARPYCVFGRDDRWREIHVRGSGGTERVVVLSDGRIVVLSPPERVDAPARLTVLDERGSATTMPVVFPRVAPDVARVLRLGLWLDGFEERRPGVVGGWIEAGGVMLGLEVALDGKATPGEFIRDAGAPFVSGRYGLGWTASHRGYETTDGGMTWRGVELPAPLVRATNVQRRACGPIGCLSHGWLRVGWGEVKSPAPPPAPPPTRPATRVAPPEVQLACEPLASMPPSATAIAAAPSTPVGPRFAFGTFTGGLSVLGSFDGLKELPPFHGQNAPTLRESERGVDIDVRELLERRPSMGTLARIYGWGPKTGDWDTLGHWQVKWLSPFAGWSEIRASSIAPPPPMIVDLTRSSNAYPYPNRQLVPGDDAEHALLVAKRSTARWETVVYELVTDRAPSEVRRADGEPFSDIEAAVRVGGRWFLSTAIDKTSAPVSIVWQVEGTIARELARVPRHFDGATGARTKLARRSDGRAIGLVVDGDPTVARPVNVRWVLPIDLASETIGEPEALGFTDLAGRSLDACNDDAFGWVLDTPLFSTVRLRLPRGSGTMNAVLARVRLTDARACIERLAGAYDGARAHPLALSGAPPAAPAAAGAGAVPVSASSQQTRFPLRCTVAPAR